MQSFFSGIHYHLTGFRYLTTPGIKRYVLMPVLLNILFFIALFYGFLHGLVFMDAWFMAHLPTWAYWLGKILWLVMIIGFIFIFLFAFLTLANIFAAPFNGVLSARVNQLVTKKRENEQSLWQLCLDVPRMIGRQLKILGYYFPRLIVLLILFFIPIVQIISTPLWFLFNAWMLSLTYFDYPADNARYSFDKLLDFVNKNRLLAIGFGSSVLVCSMIPIVNFFTMPAAVIGATLLWIDVKPKSE